jgi:hypothetical protein
MTPVKTITTPTVSIGENDSESMKWEITKATTTSMRITNDVASGVTDWTPLR